MSNWRDDIKPKRNPVRVDPNDYISREERGSGSDRIKPGDYISPRERNTGDDEK